MSIYDQTTALDAEFLLNDLPFDQATKIRQAILLAEKLGYVIVAHFVEDEDRIFFAALPDENEGEGQ